MGPGGGGEDLCRPGRSGLVSARWPGCLSVQAEILWPPPPPPSRHMALGIFCTNDNTSPLEHTLQGPVHLSSNPHGKSTPWSGMIIVPIYR